MYEPNYPLEYIGLPTSEMIDGDYIRLLEEYPNGKELEGGNKLVGSWCLVEHYFHGEQFYVPRRLVRARK